MDSIVNHLPLYYGTGSLRTFLRKFEKITQLARLDPRQKELCLRFACRDRAANFLDINTELKQATYKGLIDALAKRFDPQRGQAQAYNVFVNLKQGENTVSEFISEIEIATVEYSGVVQELKTSNERNEFLTAVFLKGLSNNIKPYVVAHKYSNMYQVFEAARKVEKVLNESKDRSSEFSQARGGPFRPQNSRTAYDIQSGGDWNTGEGIRRFLEVTLMSVIIQLIWVIQAIITQLVTSQAMRQVYRYGLV